MAVLKKGRPENEKGEWIPVRKGKEPNPAEDWKALLRPVPSHVARRIRTDYGTEDKVQIPIKVGDRELVSVQKQQVYSQEEARCITRDMATHAWIDCEDLSLLAEDEETAKAYSKLLGGFPVEVGKAVDLKGKLTDALKRVFLDDDPALATYLVEEAAELGKASYQRDRNLRKN